MTISPVIVDYGVGNLRSVQRAFQRIGADATVSADPETVVSAPALLLPGVGAFGDAMKKLNSTGLAEALREATLQRHAPLLGICLGMQLLARRSCENGDHLGLGLIDADVKRLTSEHAGLRLPHMGWNEVTPQQDCALFADIPAGADFYFVHSYHVVCDREISKAATCNYGGEFCCGLAADNVMGVQFHPEKSQKFGRQIMRNFLEIAAAGQTVC